MFMVYKVLIVITQPILFKKIQKLINSIVIVKVVYSFKMNSTYWLTKQYNTFQTYHYRGTNKILFSLHISYRVRLFFKQDLTLACEIVMWSPSQTGWFPPGTPVSSHTKTIRTHTSVPKSMINLSCRTCFVNKV